MKKNYKYNPETLEFEKTSWKRNLVYSGLFFLGGLSIVLITLLAQSKNQLELKDLEVVEARTLELESLEDNEKIIIINEGDEFTEEKLVEYLLELNIKFPDIAFAQARYESGNWGTNPGANIFHTNNNLFGMKIATMRPTTNVGIQHKHAVYDNWRMSVMDYALWQSNMTSGLNTREDYLAFLKARYAMGSYQSIEQIMYETQKKYPELNVKRHPVLENAVITTSK